MTSRDADKMRLSKGILDMKFMKKTKEKVEKQKYQQEGEEYFGNQVTTRMKQESITFIMEPSFVFCEDLIDGRLSFRGINPDIERLMEIHENEKRQKLQPKEEADVSDEKMAKRMTSFRENAGKSRKYIRRKSGNDDEAPAAKKPKFLKPVD